MKRLLLLGLLIPAILFGQQQKDLIIGLQRDVADLQDKMKQLQKSQDEKLAAIQSMLQQALDASGRAATGISAMQRDVDNKLNDQQTKLVAPVATLGSKVDQMSDEFRAVSTTVSDLRTKINAQDGKLADISSAIRVLAAQMTPQPPPSAAVGGAAPAVADPCSGLSADSLWENARRDKSKGSLDLAMKQYVSYVKCFSETANAPVAQYEIAQMYYDNGDFENAAKAYEDEERFAENPKKQEALYFKGVSLMKSEHKTEAASAFKEYLRLYPHGQHIVNAHANLKNLGFEPKSTPARKR